MMGLGWDTRKKLGSKVLASELMGVWMGYTSKPVGVRMIPTVVSNNEPVPDLMRYTNNQNLSGNGV